MVKQETGYVERPEMPVHLGLVDRYPNEMISNTDFALAKTRNEEQP